MDKRSQAAMEFLMTYGWAILVVLAAIGALAYFGVLSPDKFLPEKCTISPGINCAGHKINTDTTTLVLENGYGKNLQISSITVGTCTASYSGDDSTFNNGEIKTYVLSSCVNGAVGDRFKEDIKIVFIEQYTNLTKSTDGGLVSKVTDV